MGIQLGLMEAQKKAIEAKAKKDAADAEKTAGVDTQLAQSLIELNKTQGDLNNMTIEEVAAKVKLWGDKSTAQAKTNHWERWQEEA